MPAAKQTNWRCPECGGGARGPRRPRRDDVRRYCLPCSAKGGRLVERVSPAVEAERKRKAEAAAARRKRKAEQAKADDARRWLIKAIDATGAEVEVHIEREVRRVAKRAKAGWRLVEVTLHRRQGGGYVSGRCWPGSGRIHLTVYDGVPLEVLQELVAHEVAHLWRHDKDHGRQFRDRLAKVASAGYPGVGRIPAAMATRRQEEIIIDRLTARTRRLAE